MQAYLSKPGLLVTLVDDEVSCKIVQSRQAFLLFKRVVQLQKSTDTDTPRRATYKE